jgi:hypothetical protein
MPSLVRPSANVEMMGWADLLYPTLTSETVFLSCFRYYYVNNFLVNTLRRDISEILTSLVSKFDLICYLQVLFLAVLRRFGAGWVKGTQISFPRSQRDQPKYTLCSATYFATSSDCR